MVIQKENLFTVVANYGSLKRYMGTIPSQLGSLPPYLLPNVVAVEEIMLNTLSAYRRVLW
jgi:hypothetical protein